MAISPSRPLMSVFMISSEFGSGPILCVVKPVESAGSDDVFKCTSAAEVRDGVNTIVGKINGLGEKNEGVLIQEFLDGEEYVVDSVSRDGQHKLMAIWKYDKRAIHDANFVYFGMKLQDAAGAQFDGLIAYAFSVLDALEIFILFNSAARQSAECVARRGGCYLKNL